MRAPERRDRVFRHRVHLTGDGDGFDAVAGGECIGAIDDRGVCLAEPHLRQDLAHVQLAGRDMGANGFRETGTVQRRRGVEDSKRIRPDRDLRRSEHDPLRPRKILQAADSRRIAGGDHDDRLVAGENPRRVDETRRLQRAKLPSVGRREHIGSGAVLDLGTQLLRAREIEDDLRGRLGALEAAAQFLESIAERAGGKDDQLGRGDGCEGRHSAPMSRNHDIVSSAPYGNSVTRCPDRRVS